MNNNKGTLCFSLADSSMFSAAAADLFAILGLPATDGTRVAAGIVDAAAAAGALSATGDLLLMRL